MNKDQIIQSLNGGLIVSCQVKKNDPQYMNGCISSLAKAAIAGGAVGLRINEPDNIKEVRSITKLPIIGLWKIYSKESEVFMTPTMESVTACIEAGADIIAIDGTDRQINGNKGFDIINQIKKKYPDIIIFADVRDEEDAIICADKGADIIAPTFYRFKDNPKSVDLPDWEMFAKMCDIIGDKAKVFMEGKLWTPDDCIKAFHYGAYAVVVGSAITRPQLITQRFFDHINGFPTKRSLFY